MNNSVIIKRNITVKAIITPALKNEMISSLRSTVQRLDLELQQMEFQGKRTLADLEKQNIQQAMSVKQQLEAEKQKRSEAKVKALNQLKEVSSWQEGSEVIQGSLEGIVEAKVGDNLAGLMSAEIVVKDGIVVEIRCPAAGGGIRD